MILLIDNYDSFVHNLARHFERLGHETQVVRNDCIGVCEIRQMRPSALIISPGPCTPKEAGISVESVKSSLGKIPVLGVCLGHQVIAEALGGQVERSPEPMHGRTSQIRHDGRGVFSELPNPLTVCRYHSLTVSEKTLPDCLEVSSRASDGTIMSMRHRSMLCVGVQFHPEAILTKGGYELLGSFLRMGDLPTTTTPKAAAELVAVRPKPVELPQTPVTF